MTIHDGAWHHIAISRDSSDSIRLFVDGIEKNSATASVDFTNTNSLVVGKMDDSSG